MENINKSLKYWLEEVEKYSQPSFESLPEIELYMDQVLTYLDRQLKLFTISSLDKKITSSMINNYVKGNVIDMPVGKKYSKVHLAKILEVNTLKRVFSIAEIKQILDSQYAASDDEECYEFFKEESKSAFQETINDTKGKLDSISTNDTTALTQLALEIGLKAQANALLASRILNYIRIKETLEDEPKKETVKKEKKEKSDK